jgi:DNA-binding NarL/FixJ family response regulator
MHDKTRVLIVDDHVVVIEGIKTVLSSEPDFEVVGSALDGGEAVSMIESLKPDIVILDISMPNVDGMETAREIKKIDQNIQILIYSMSSSKEHITAFFREGVSGYVLKGEPLSEVRLALKALREGAAFYSESVRESLQDHIKALESGGKGENVADTRNGTAGLSVREKEVFVLLADGMTIKDVARRLHISPKTVETHKYNIMDKLHVKSLAEFTKIAVKKGLIEI